ncbi:MAG: hypothetical protein GOU97_02935 [Nanoarchaeota archaeon]|nr:hypothetical protein [Nanoarchaeota archaeon]
MKELCDVIIGMHEPMINTKQRYGTGAMNIKHYILIQRLLTHEIREVDPFLKQFICLKRADDPAYMKSLKTKVLKIIELIIHEKRSLKKFLDSATKSLNKKLFRTITARLEEIEEEKRVLYDTNSEINLALVPNA